MKIRKSFVTNSSSSSFVLAIKNDITKEDIISSLNYKIILEFIKDFELKEEESFNNKTEYEILELFAEDLLSEMKFCNLQLDNWKIIGGEIYSDCLYEQYGNAAIYYNAIESNDKIKVG